MTRPRPLAAALILSLAALLAPVGAQAQDKLTLMLDWFVNPDHGPILIAEETGYFADQGLAVEIIAPADPSDPPKIIAAGRADLCAIARPHLANPAQTKQNKTQQNNINEEHTD